MSGEICGTYQAECTPDETQTRANNSEREVAYLRGWKDGIEFACSVAKGVVGA